MQISLFNINLEKKQLKVNSSWFNGDCHVTTYQIEELIGTKLRALYQRKKGRDLYDIYKSLITDSTLSREKILQSYQSYMKHEASGIPPREVYRRNIVDKMNDSEFLGDTTALLRTDEVYDPEEGFIIIKTELINKM